MKLSPKSTISFENVVANLQYVKLAENLRIGVRESVKTPIIYDYDVLHSTDFSKLLRKIQCRKTPQSIIYLPLMRHGERVVR